MRLSEDTLAVIIVGSIVAAFLAAADLIINAFTNFPPLWVPTLILGIAAGGFLIAVTSREPE